MFERACTTKFGKSRDVSTVLETAVRVNEKGKCNESWIMKVRQNKDNKNEV